MKKYFLFFLVLMMSGSACSQEISPPKPPTNPSPSPNPNPNPNPAPDPKPDPDNGSGTTSPPKPKEYPKVVANELTYALKKIKSVSEVDGSDLENRGLKAVQVEFCKKAVLTEIKESEIKFQSQVYEMLSQADSHTWEKQLLVLKQKARLTPKEFYKVIYDTKVSKKVRVTKENQSLGDDFVDVSLGEQEITCWVPRNWHLEVFALNVEVRPMFLNEDFCLKEEMSQGKKVCLDEWLARRGVVRHRKLVSSHFPDERDSEFFLDLSFKTNSSYEAELSDLYRQVPALQSQDVTVSSVFNSLNYHSGTAIRGIGVGRTSLPRESDFWILLGDVNRNYLKENKLGAGLSGFSLNSISEKNYDDTFEEFQKQLKFSASQDLLSSYFRFFDVPRKSFVSGSPVSVKAQKEKMLDEFFDGVGSEAKSKYWLFILAKSENGVLTLTRVSIDGQASENHSETVYVLTERDLGLPLLADF
jgi:hypothetical protein